MRETRVTFGTAALCATLGLFFTQCKQAPSDEDDAGAAGEGGTPSTGTGGAGAGAGAPGSAGHGATGGGGGTSGAPATGGSSGSTATGGSGGTSGAPATGGTSATGGASAAGGSAGMTSSAGGTTGSCEAKVIPVRPAEPTPVDEATFTAQWPALACAGMKPCCGTEAPAYDEAKCLAYAPTALEKTDKKYDAVEAASCLESLKAIATGCPGPTSYRGLPYACTLVYRGALTLGTECLQDKECAPDARGLVECSIQTGICTVEVRGKVGDACNESCEISTDTGVCYPLNDPTDPAVVVTCHQEDGVRCLYKPEEGSSFIPEVGAGTCQPALGLGCSCLFADSSFCNGQSNCSDGSDGNKSTCVARVGAGMPCVLNMDCAVGNYCDRDAANPTCVPRKHANEPCTDHDQCYGGYCWTSVCVLDSGETRGNFHDIFCDGVGTDD